MPSVFNLYQTNPTAQAIIVLSLVCMMGLSVGSIKIRGIGLGSAGVLFAGIIVGHFSQPIDRHTLEFVKEFGLTLFVFCIGLQLGPGFFASLRDSGMRLNMFAVAVVMLGVLSAVIVGRLLRIDNAAVLGLYSGATMNTPSLGAAQQALVSLPNITEFRAALPSIACAVSYPMSIIGVIGSLIVLKALFGVNVANEARAHALARKQDSEPLARRTLVVENPNLEGVALSLIPGLRESGVVVSRIRHTQDRSVSIATGKTVLHIGDTLLAIGSAGGLDQFERVIGRLSHENLLAASSAVSSRRVVLTNKAILGRTVKGLDLERLHGVIVTRVARGDLELVAAPNMRLRFGDTLQVVGADEEISEAVKRLGNSVRALNETQFVPLFAGIAMGIVLGSLPIACPGLPQPLRVGLAGGALVVAILLGRLGRIGRLVWHMPRNANLAFREFGIALFFASIGLMAGPPILLHGCQ